MTRLQVHLSERDGVVIAVLTGEIDASNVASLADQLFAAMSNESLGAVLDLGAVDYVDSAGVGLFFDAARRLSVRRQGLGLALPESSPLRRLFEVTKVATVAVVRTSVDDCVNDLRELAENGHK